MRQHHLWRRQPLHSLCLRWPHQNLLPQERSVFRRWLGYTHSSICLFGLRLYSISGLPHRISHFDLFGPWNQHPVNCNQCLRTATPKIKIGSNTAKVKNLRYIWFQHRIEIFKCGIKWCWFQEIGKFKKFWSSEFISGWKIIHRTLFQTRSANFFRTENFVEIRHTCP